MGLQGCICKVSVERKHVYLSPGQHVYQQSESDAFLWLLPNDQACNISRSIGDGTVEGHSLELPLLCTSQSPILYPDTDSQSLEQAAEPENLAQETIIDNLAPQEAARLSRVRNIGIAVRSGVLSVRSLAEPSRHTSTVGRPPPPSECSTTQDE